MIFIFVYALAYAEKTMSTRCLAMLGTCSLELYLFNVSLRVIFDYMGYAPGVLTNYLALTTVSIVLSVVTHYLIGKGLGRLS